MIYNLFHFIKWLFKKNYDEFKSQLSFPPNIKTAPNVRITNPKNFTSGSDVFIDYNAYLHCGGMEWCENKGKISIGKGTYIGPHAILFGMGEIEVGEHVMISPHVVITSVQHPYNDLSKPMYKQPPVFKKVIICDDVYIGSNAVITPGVVIGKGAVIGAGAVVTKDIPSNAIALGIPAKAKFFRDTPSQK